MHLEKYTQVTAGIIAGITGANSRDTGISAGPVAGRLHHLTNGIRNGILRYMNKTLQKIIDLTREGKLTWTTGTLPSFALTGDYRLELGIEEDVYLKVDNFLFQLLHLDDQEDLSVLYKLVRPKTLVDFQDYLDSLDAPQWLPVTEDMSPIDTGDVLEVRMTLAKVLTEQELDLAVGAIGYASTEHLRGRSGLITSTKGVTGQQVTVIFDLTRSNRSDVAGAVRDFLEASLQYLKEGKYHKGSGIWLGLEDPSIMTAYEVKSTL